MKLFQFRNCLRQIINASKHGSSRFNSGGNPKETISRDPVRQVFLSQSNDVFTNLALEDWLYRNHDFAHKHLLLLWRNNPCVVIGRHQNPWLESNVPFLRENKIALARRNSGGGTVYHDLGNLNCTFFTRRSKYNRRQNLDIICDALKLVTNLDISVNERDDIVLNNSLKISGTAAKLGKDTAYHHCTVLVNVNECLLHDSLNSKAEGVESRATQSVRVPVKNLAQLVPSLDILEVETAIGFNFLRTNIDGEDIGEEGLKDHWGFQRVRPDNDWFPGLDKLKEDFLSDKWIFGKTPKFRVTRNFQVPQHVLWKMAERVELSLEIEVINGIIENVKIRMPTGYMDDDFVNLAELLVNMTFDNQLVHKFLKTLNEKKINVPYDKQHFLLHCVDEVTKKFV